MMIAAMRVDVVVVVMKRAVYRWGNMLLSIWFDIAEIVGLDRTERGVGGGVRW